MANTNEQIIARAQYEINHGLGPSKVYRDPAAIVRPDEVVLSGHPEIRAGQSLVVRCEDLGGTGNFVAIAKVVRSTKVILVAQWKLIEMDELQLTEAFENVREKAA
jgi:hypothetical protein